MAMMRQFKPGVDYDAWTIKKEDGTLVPNTTGVNMDGRWAPIGGKWVSVKLIEVK